MEFSPLSHFDFPSDAVARSTLQEARSVFARPYSLKTNGSIALRDQEKAIGITAEMLQSATDPITWVIAVNTQNPFLEQVPGRATIKCSYVIDEAGELRRQLTFGIVPIRGQSRFTAQRMIITENISDVRREGLDESINDEAFISAVVSSIENADFSDQNTTLVNVYAVDH